MTCCKGPRGAPDFDPDYEGPSAADIDRFGSETRVCPACATEVWDGASLCPACGFILEDEISNPRSVRNLILTVGLILGGVAFVLVVLL
jgi:hypothetical protein